MYAKLGAFKMKYAIYEKVLKNNMLVYYNCFFHH